MRARASVLALAWHLLASAAVPANAPMLAAATNYVVFQTLVPEIGTGTVTLQTNGLNPLALEVSSGQWLIGTQQVAWLIRPRVPLHQHLYAIARDRQAVLDRASGHGRASLAPPGAKDGAEPQGPPGGSGWPFCRPRACRSRILSPLKLIRQRQ